MRLTKSGVDFVPDRFGNNEIKANCNMQMQRLFNARVKFKLFLNASGNNGVSLDMQRAFYLYHKQGNRTHEPLKL